MATLKIQAASEYSGKIARIIYNVRMISRLTGSIVHTDLKYVVLDVNGSAIKFSPRRTWPVGSEIALAPGEKT